MPRNNSLEKFYNFFHTNLSSAKGQVLIEALIALTFLTVAFFPAFSLLGQSLSANRTSAQSYTATYLAAEGIEIARNIVDGNGIQGNAWNKNLTSGDYEVGYNDFSMTSADRNQLRFLIYEPSTDIYSYNGSVRTPFKRLITINMVGSDEIKINSVVSWVGLGGGIFNVNLEDHFMNWRAN